MSPTDGDSLSPDTSFPMQTTVGRQLQVTSFIMLSDPRFRMMVATT